MPEAVLNGYKHHWREQGDGEPLVMLHGAAGTGLAFERHLPALSQWFRVIAPDMRGMGGSEHVASIPPAAWIDDLEALLDHLGIEKAHVYGVSLGARVALRFAIDHPQRVRSLVLEQPILLNEDAGNASLNANLGSFDNLSAEQQEARRNQHGDDWRDVLRNYFNIRNDPGLQEHLNLRELASGVRLPTLILRGDVIEPVHPLPHALELHERITGSWLWIRPNSGGNLLNSVPQEAYEVIRSFTDAAARSAAGSR